MLISGAPFPTAGALGVGRMLPCNKSANAQPPPQHHSARQVRHFRTFLPASATGSIQEPGVPGTRADTATTALIVDRDTRLSNAPTDPHGVNQEGLAGEANIEGPNRYTTTTIDLDSMPLPTPLKPDRLAEWLDGYDTDKKDFLIKGFTSGFHVGFSGTVNSAIPKNLKSAYDMPGIVQEHIDEELLAGRIAGPFKEPPFKFFQCSPIGLVPKKNGGFRLIQHLSFPQGSSVNDQIGREWATASYATIEDAIDLVTATCKHAFMAKTDVKSAFRTVPLHPSVRYLFVFHWNENFYVDLTLPMGCSSSCFIFETLSTAVEWVALTKFSIPMVHILDDFFLASVSQQVGSHQLKFFFNLCEDIGLPMAPEKTFNPSNVLSFVGYEIDTIQEQVRLPIDKVKKCCEEIQAVCHRNKITLHGIQSLLGLLNFACAVILPGRPFLRRLTDLTIGIRNPKHYIRITNNVKSDLNMWLEFLSAFNGKVLFLDKAVPTHHVGLFTDASGSIGFGAMLGTQWFQGRWSVWWIGQNITLLELYPIALAIEVWGPLLSNKRLILNTDNMALVSVLNKQTSKEPLVMVLVRKLVLSCLKFNILLYAQHVPGTSNGITDSLSRFQMERFRTLAPQADQRPVPIPHLPVRL